LEIECGAASGENTELLVPVVGDQFFITPMAVGLFTELTSFSIPLALTINPNQPTNFPQSSTFPDTKS
jgi:hypothetical protein